MTTKNVTLPLPEALLVRFQQMAKATSQPVTALLVRAVEVGGPPNWEEAPARFQADLAALDRLDDDALWCVARSRRSEAEMARLQELLDKNANQLITSQEQSELAQYSEEADLLMLRKAHAVALLRWRGHAIPPAEKL